MFFVVVFVLGTYAHLAQAPLAHCDFGSHDGRWEGACGPLFDQTPKFSLTAAPAITSGAYRTGALPSAVWAGEMTDQGYPNAAVELELFHDGTGILRTAYGWFSVSRFRQLPAAIRFDLDTLHEVPPSDLDRAIVRRAAVMLSSAANWNRNDNRQCPATARTWSMYCALERATTEVTGGFHHRRPALEIVRRIVAERSVGRPYHHRLMDFNNDPRTSLEDVQAVLREALARMP